MFIESFRQVQVGNKLDDGLLLGLHRNCMTDYFLWEPRNCLLEAKGAESYRKDFHNFFRFGVMLNTIINTFRQNLM